MLGSGSETLNVLSAHTGSITGQSSGYLFLALHSAFWRFLSQSPCFPNVVCSGARPLGFVRLFWFPPSSKARRSEFLLLQSSRCLSASHPRASPHQQLLQ